MQKTGLTRSTRRTFTAALLVFTAALAVMSSAKAQPSIQTLGVFSVLGDGLQLVYPADATDTRLDRNLRESLPTKDIGFDQAALRAVRDTMSRVQPQARLQMFRSNTSMEPAAQRALAEGASKAELPAWIVGTIDSAKLSHLLLITRHRGDASFPVHEGFTIGRGMVEGIGYYLDKSTEIKNMNTGRASLGFLGAFVMLRLQLLDAKTGELLGSQDVRVGQMHAGRNDKEVANIWDALDPREKVEVLRQLVQDNVGRVLPAVLAGR